MTKLSDKQKARTEKNYQIVATLFEMGKVPGSREVHVTEEDLTNMGWVKPLPTQIYTPLGPFRIRDTGGNYKIEQIIENAKKREIKNEHANDPLPIDLNKKVGLREVAKSGKTQEEIDSVMKKKDKE